MAGSVNKVILVGNLGKDPEVRVAQSGVKIVNLTLATSESWTDKMTGARQDRTEWHRVVIMNDRLGEIAEKYLRKGSKVFIEGRLQTRKWTDQAGQERYTTEVLLGRFGGEMVLLGSNTQAAGSEHAPYEAQSSAAGTSSVGGATDYVSSGASPGATSGNGWDVGPIDDDIPF